MNWGKSIVLGFVMFISFIGILAYKMIIAKVDLVKPDYYQSELDYQKKFEILKNSEKISADSIISYMAENDLINLNFPYEIEEGEMHFYRPSDKNLDLKIPFNSTDKFTYNTQNLANGYWKIIVIWKHNQKQYTVEKDLNLF
jgi:hypothetical protein